MRLNPKRVLTWLLGVFAVSTIGCALAVAGFVYWEHSKQEELDLILDKLDTYVPPTSVEVFDRHGVRFDTFAIERRIWTPLEEMPRWMPQAVIAAEDRRFWTHGGVDPMGILRAAVANFRAGTIRQGGSTLTQQLVKNLVVGDKKSLQRKIDEALLARRLESRMSKEQILELYLNYAYFGSGNYGVEAASQDYFGVSVRDIDISQAAMLAALIPAPSRYSPRRNKDGAREQRRRVLMDLAEVRILSVQEAERRAQAPIDPPIRPTHPVVGVGNAYRTSVRRTVRDQFHQDSAYRLGLKIDTPYDPAVQAVAEAAVHDAVHALEKRQGQVVPQGRIRTTAEFQVFLNEGRGMTSTDAGPTEPAPGDCFEAMVTLPWKSLRAGPFKVTLDPAEWGTRVRSFDVEEPAMSLASEGRWGQLFDVCITQEGTARLVRTEWAESAAVVIENATGGVVALVGGREMPLEGFNHATQARRQPGSTFKPYVYGSALRGGMAQLDDVFDGPLTVGGWSPKNAGGGYAGEIPMRFALASSLNTVAVRLALQVGVDEVREFARDAGVRTPIRDDLTMALGSSEVTVIDQAVGYATLARYGKHTEAVFLSRVRNFQGAHLASAGEDLHVYGTDVRLPGSNDSQAIPEAVAFQLVDMLGEVVRSGTGRRAFDPKTDRAGKTGTTSFNKDAWFVGMTPTHTVAVWVGADDNQTLGSGEYGGRTALPAWISIVEALEGDAEHRWSVPPSVMLVPFGGRLMAMPRGRAGEVHALEVSDVLPPFPGG